MKIIATVRTRNEERNIGRFCEAYQGIANEILVADGGSEDRTVEIAESFPNVTVLPFDQRIEVKGGHWINPQGSHVNFLFEQARQRDPDWIIFDDCDCVPNYILQKEARGYLDKALSHDRPAVFVRRVYMWGEHYHFPDLHRPNTSLWAFRRGLNIHADTEDEWHLTMMQDDHNLSPLRPFALHLEFPQCLLHYSWPTEEAAQKKVKFYRESGVQPTARHPKDFGGKMKIAEWFMTTEAPRVPSDM